MQFLITAGLQNQGECTCDIVAIWREQILVGRPIVLQRCSLRFPHPHTACYMLAAITAIITYDSMYYDYGVRIVAVHSLALAALRVAQSKWEAEFGVWCSRKAVYNVPGSAYSRKSRNSLEQSAGGSCVTCARTSMALAASPTPEGTCSSSRIRRILGFR